MRSDVRRDLSASARDFLAIVWPAIEKICGGGVLQPVETVIDDDDFAKALDIYSGIDAWQLVTDRGLRGIASRVQWSNLDWGTITIRKQRRNRYETEWDRIQMRRDNAEAGFVRAALIVQAYILGDKDKGGGTLLNAYVLRADDFYGFCTSEFEVESARAAHRATKPCWYSETNKGDGTVFAVFPIKQLKHAIDVRDTANRAANRQMDLFDAPAPVPDSLSL